MTPGIQPRQVKIKIIKNEPHPLSTTDKGGKIIANKTLINDINTISSESDKANVPFSKFY